MSLELSRQEYWSGFPCHPPEDLPDPGIEPSLLCLLHLQAGSVPPALFISSSIFINVLTYHWEAPYDTEISLLDNYPKEIKICLHKYFYMNVYSSIIYNSQKLGTTQVLISEWKNKFGIYIPWDATQHRNKYTAFICINTLNNIDECQKH